MFLSRINCFGRMENSVDLKVILLFLKLFQLVQTQIGVIERVISNHPFNEFSISTDRFTNPTDDFSFCEKRNAVLCGGINCENCICRNGETFISYNHGCMEKYQSDTLVNGLSCLQYKVNSTSIPTFSWYTFDICQKLIYPDTINSSKLCSIEYLEEVNGLNGSLKKIDNKYFATKLENGINCVGCKTSGECNLLPNGKVYKLSMKCSTTVNQSPVKTCFVFKKYGKDNVNLDGIKDPTTTTSPTTTTTSLVTTTSIKHSTSTVYISSTKLSTTVSTTEITVVTNSPNSDTTAEPEVISTQITTTSAEGTSSTTTSSSTSLQPVTIRTKPTTKGAHSTKQITTTTKASEQTTLGIWKEKSTKDQGPKNNLIIIVGTVIGVLLIIAIVIGSVVCRKRGQKRKQQGNNIQYSNSVNYSTVTNCQNTIEDDNARSNLYADCNTYTGVIYSKEDDNARSNLYADCNTYTGVIYSKDSAKASITQNELYEETSKSSHPLYETTERPKENRFSVIPNVSYDESSKSSTPLYEVTERPKENRYSVATNVLYGETSKISNPLYETTERPKENRFSVIPNVIYDETSKSSTPLYEATDLPKENRFSGLQNVLYDGTSRSSTALYETTERPKENRYSVVTNVLYGESKLSAMYAEVQSKSKNGVVKENENMSYGSHSLQQHEEEQHQFSEDKQHPTKNDNSLYTKNENLIYEPFEEKSVSTNPIYG